MREVEVDQQDTDQVYFQDLQKLEQCINQYTKQKASLMNIILKLNILI